ncbi:MAG: hypothetical protein B7Y16_00420 [Methylotenera sp. 24-45-7]|jgi:uncharacterized low-complexity protein|nr:MAG: hypothetical protein B7Y16_00420 [Methylotenera sp. 24-45-7]OZA08863.1 MAG: hypothetical protein B7X97_04865 [Methylotenera sp. 17-45-7]HQS38395.1 hypothetical protein [Methylotenera sp.]HQS43308.1 hypothetical protein [Methylotenera sp.]
MNKTQKTISLAIGGAFALSIAATSIHAAENPFALKSLSSGYQVADNHDAKMKDGKCGTGKCGGSKKMDKAHEGKCSAEKAAEGKCSAEKAAEGKCSAEKAAEGKCGGDKK